MVLERCIPQGLEFTQFVLMFGWAKGAFLRGFQKKTQPLKTELQSPWFFGFRKNAATGIHGFYLATHLRLEKNGLVGQKATKGFFTAFHSGSCFSEKSSH